FAMPVLLMCGCCAAAVGYRYVYTKLMGRHTPPPVTVSFTLQKSTQEAFAVIRNPQLLDQTTPFWFRLIIRTESVEAINDFLAKSDPLVAENLPTFPLKLPLYFDYWMLAFIVPFPWRSKVTQCEKLHDSGKSSSSTPSFQLTYEQAIGPFLGGFIHTHTVIARDGGSQIDDSIEFDVTSEPVVNNITWYVLNYLLRGRCENLNLSYGGSIVT
ncbi:40S ribosomal protein S9-1, partial [Durusdinium trenchii]